MKTARSPIIMFLAVSLLFSGIVMAQTKPAIPVPPKSVVPTISIFVGGNYFGPKYTGVNDVYTNIENSFLLPSGSDFKNYYNVLLGVRIAPGVGQAIQGEFSGSVLKSTKDKTTNFIQEYYTGGSYLMSMSVQSVSIYLGGGLGYIWLNTQRTYTTRLGVAQVNAQLAQAHGILGLEFYNQSGASFALEGRYNYATTLVLPRADLNFTMKGVSAGIRLGIPIIM